MTERPSLSDPTELLGHLRAGDQLAHCLLTGWRLVTADRAVEPEAVAVLRRACVWFGPDNEPLDFGGGCLAPLGDGLPGIGTAQTWVWSEGRSEMRH